MDVVEVVRSDNTRILELLMVVPDSVPTRQVNSAALLAAKTGRARCLDILLSPGCVSADLKDASDNALLYHAAEAGHTEVVKILLDYNCDVNNYSSHGCSPLHAAARNGHEKCVQMMIYASANLNALDSARCSPLILAAKNCSRTMGIMKLLTEAGCNLDLQDKNGRTALHYTSHKAIGTRLLLAAGANPNIKDNDDNTPIILAATEGFDGIVRSLCEYNCDPDITNSCGMTAAHYLAMKNHGDGLDAISYHGGNVSLADNMGNMPLWYACHHNSPDAVKALLRANCRLDPVVGNSQVPTGGIPLQTALELRRFGVAKLLVIAGCSLYSLYQWMADVERRNAEHAAHQAMLFAHQREEIEEDIEEKEAMCWFEEWMHRPHTLRQLCRVQIRRCIGGGVAHKEVHLPLPQAMRDFLTLREMDDHFI